MVTLFAEPSMVQLVSNVPTELTSLMESALLSTPDVLLSPPQMVNALPATTGSN